jgi:hypothetical protein
MAHRRRPSNTMRSFLAYLEEIEHAVLRRDSLRVTALLRKRTATHLPRSVREELLLISRQPRESLRAPVQFLRFQHRMMQLSKSESRLPTAQTELELEPLVPAGSIRRRSNGERRAAACDPLDDVPGDAAS